MNKIKLEPGKTYYYRIKSKGKVVKTGSFKTAPLACGVAEKP